MADYRLSLALFEYIPVLLSAFGLYLLGKVPVLDTGEVFIPATGVIMDYLENTHPAPVCGPPTLANAPLVTRWRQWVQSREFARRVIRELEKALRRFLQRTGESDL